MKKIVIIFSTMPLLIIGQTVKNPGENYVFGQIFGGFRYSIKESYTPRAAFEFNQGIIGYYHQISDKVSGKIMYDVTRTTHLYEITDTAGNPLNYSYFEGSKYTAYLKMAEIKWDFSEYFSLRLGQLLSTQYLTFQDPFWGLRYVDVTFQEKFRLGMPADFGAQLDFRYKGVVLNQLSVVNGEGPFRYQDDGGKFLVSDNIQISPIENLTLKIYGGYEQTSDTSAQSGDKYTLSGFAGYKTDKYRIGAEYIYLTGFSFIEEWDYSGISVFGMYSINEKIGVLGRYDFLQSDLNGDITNTDYFIAGLHFEPVPKFTMSANFRYYSEGALPFIYGNFGLKF